jgi:hypothetical protein
MKTFGCDYSNGKIKLPDQNWPEKGNIAIDIEVASQPQIRQYITIPKNYITRIKLFARNTFHKAPGNSIKLGINKIFDNSFTEILNKRRQVDKFLTGCKIYVTGGDYKNGTFKITDDIFKIEYHEAGIIAEPIFDPSLADTFNFKLDYIDNYNASIIAGSGYGGYSGMSGSSGANGGCSGCNGSDGQNGSDGSNGSSGENGHDVSVDFDAYYDTILNTDLCLVHIEDLADKRTWNYLVNPKGGTLKLTSSGGNGGDGGAGGSGGSGGDGGAGSTHTYERTKNVTVTDSTGTHTVQETETYTETDPGGHGGNGGYGGSGGSGGYGGDGGKIYVYYTEASMPFLSILTVNSLGGSGGFSGSGGYGGSGGSGGNGNPSGSGGFSGSSGSSGFSGSSGRNGEVIFTKKQ